MKRNERKGMFHNTSNKINTNRNKKMFSFSIFMIIFLASFTTMFVIFLPYKVKAAETVNLLPDGVPDPGPPVVQQWIPFPGEVPHFTLVNDWPGPDEDDTYVYTNVLNEIEEFNHETSLLLEGATITNVRVTARMKRVATGGGDSASVTLGLKIEGIRYETPVWLQVQPVYTDITWDWANNPAPPGNPWRKIDIDALQSSIKLVQMTSSIVRCTQIYITVTYTANSVPTNDGITGTSWQDTNNCYGQNDYYTLTTEHADGDTIENINYVELKICQGLGGIPTYYMTFRYTEVTNIFSIEGEGDWKWDFDADNCTHTPIDSDTVSLTWKFKPQWDATEEDGVDIELTIVDDQLASVTNEYINVFDVVQTLAANSITASDSRVNVGGTTTINFDVHYAIDSTGNNPSATENPPDLEFTHVVIYDEGDEQVGDPDETIVDGNGSAEITLPSSPGNYPYNLYVDMTDDDFADCELPLQTVSVIADRIVVNWSADSYTVDAGTEVTITLDDIIYDYDNASLGAVYQYDATKNLWGESGTVYKDDYSSNSFTFTPNLAGIYNFTISSINESTYGLTANQTNCADQGDTQNISLTVKQNISLVKNIKNNGVNYITWGANDSVMASTLADDLSLESETTYIQKFNASSGNWSAYLVGVSGDFEIDRWDHLRILIQQNRSHPFTPDSGCFDPQEVDMNFTDDNNGYYYITWNQDYSIDPSDFIDTLETEGEIANGDDITIYVYDPTTNTWPSYKQGRADVFNKLSSIQPYDVISFKARKDRANIAYNPDGW